MQRNIIQHHPAIDFDEYFHNLNQGFVGIDYNDYLTIFKEGEVTHSFLGTADREERIKGAIADAVDSDEARKLVATATSLMLVVHYSPTSDKTLTTAEMSAISDFVGNMPENCNVTWSLSNDETLGNAVKVLILVNVKADI